MEPRWKGLATRLHDRGDRGRLDVANTRMVSCSKCQEKHARSTMLAHGERPNLEKAAVSSQQDPGTHALSKMY
jgi:hypothetical protein